MGLGFRVEGLMGFLVKDVGLALSMLPFQEATYNFGAPLSMMPLCEYTTQTGD